MDDVAYRTARVAGLTVFCREAGAADAPALVLLHGFPSASQQFRELIPLLADRFHIGAPDLPGFGKSDMPPRSDFIASVPGPDPSTGPPAGAVGPARSG